MPTRLSVVIALLAVALYLLANQTQVGWVYVMSNGLVGLLLVAFFLSKGMLKPLQGRRQLSNLARRRNPADLTPGPANGDAAPELAPPDFFEDDPVQVTLTLSHTRLKPAFLIEGQEQCPFAPPAGRQQRFFVSSLFKGQSVPLRYQTRCHRRGLYHFPPLKLQSKGPFNLFGTRHTLAVPGQILIYPDYYPLNRMRLLENKGFANRKVMRVGSGSEVIGTREYRSGDSLRQIHWRNTARVGKLVVKEFADEDQLTMTVLLDLSTGGSVGQGKFSTFETAVRLAASLGYYATRHTMPFYLAGQSQRRPPPRIALSWPGILNYLAKAENDGDTPLANLLRTLPPLPFLVVLASHPTEPLGRELATLPHRGIQTLALFITPEGTLPAWATALAAPGLEVKPVEPRHWPAALKEL